MQANLLAICRWTYPRCDSRLPAIADNFVQFRVFLLVIVRVFLPAFGVPFDSVWWVFSSTILVFLPANCMWFWLQKQALLNVGRRQICMSSLCKIPRKDTLCSSKFTCGFRKFARNLFEVLAAQTQVNLPMFTGKLQVTHVNCVWGLFTCVILHAPVLQCMLLEKFSVDLIFPFLRTYTFLGEIFYKNKNEIIFLWFALLFFESSCFARSVWFFLKQTLLWNQIAYN